MIFPKYFPEKCPHADAVEAEGEVYRIVKAAPPAESDFFTSYELSIFPKRDLCMRCGLSVFRQINDAYLMMDKYPNLGTRIARGELSNQHGMLKQTGRPSHHTWWIVENLNRVELFVLVPESEE